MNIILDLFRGAVIGIANIIPGVSGGTMALVLGIYQRILRDIELINQNTIIAFLKIFTFKKQNLKNAGDEFKRIDGFFIIKIVAGALGIIVLLAGIKISSINDKTVMTYLLTDHHDATYGFFFGLVALSFISPLRLIKKINLSAALSALAAVILILTVSFSMSDENLIKRAQVKQKIETVKDGSQKTSVSFGDRAIHYGYLFFLGAIAISAMILPGVSGSFLLLLMGGYFMVMDVLSNRMFIDIGFFAAGCLIGLVLFSRFLNFLLNRWHDQTMAFLVGLVLGSLWMIWPFKKTVLIGKETVYLSNIFPSNFGTNEIVTGITIISGMVIVGIMIWLEIKYAKTESS